MLAADGETARPDCAVADNEEFCRCVVNSNGDLALVRSCTVTLLLSYIYSTTHTQCLGPRPLTPGTPAIEIERAPDFQVLNNMNTVE